MIILKKNNIYRISISAAGTILCAGLMIFGASGCSSKQGSADITISNESIKIEGTGAKADNSTITISNGGTYKIKGSIDEGQIIVDADSDVKLVLNGVSITSKEKNAIYAKNGDVTIKLEDGTENVITSGTESMLNADTSKTSTESDKTTTTKTTAGQLAELAEDAEDTSVAETKRAAIYSKDDITIKGSGTLSVNGYINNGIQSKDKVKIKSGNITVTSNNDAVKGKDSVKVNDGTITLKSGGDGIQSDADLVINNGTFDITSGGGYTESTKKTNQPMQGGSMDRKPGMDFQLPDGFDTWISSASDIPDDVKTWLESIKSSMSNTDSADGKAGFKEIFNVPDDFSTWLTSATDIPDTISEWLKNIQTMSERKMSRGDDKSATDKSTTDKSTTDKSTTDSSDEKSTKGIKAQGTLTIAKGTFSINSADDALHSNDVIAIKNGDFSIDAGDDGMHADNKLTIDAGKIDIKNSNEGIEATLITVNDGDISVISSDDGMNACGGSNNFGNGGDMQKPDMQASADGEKSTGDMPQAPADGEKPTGDMPQAPADGEKPTGDMPQAPDDSAADNKTQGKDSEDESSNTSVTPDITINGGTLYIDAGGDGIDSNGNITINDGDITIDGTPNGADSAIDYGLESGGKAVINGGTLIGTGTSSMAENFDSDSSKQCSILYATDSKIEAGTEIKITDSTGKSIYTYKTNKECNCIQYSSKDLKLNETYTITAGDVSGEIKQDVTAYSNNTTKSGFGGGMRGKNSSFDSQTTDNSKSK